MREILFRGKSFDNKWRYGSLLVDTYYEANLKDLNRPKEIKVCQIRYQDGWSSKPKQIEVNCNTIGQYTGLKDKNGNEIFEGDIIIYTNNQNGVYEIGKKMKGFIVFDEYNQCYISRNNFQKDMNWQYAENFEVIGNIYDKPELLGEEV